jgi:hypothetical protein
VINADDTHAHTVAHAAHAVGARIIKLGHGAG